ncbi:aspartic proteinase nepenthesin-1-like [Hordeum vulgare subsp. vulgare]|uniref:aspartic proteinase nepenthesin-1-like n=1 Tax=Hordeum vulgare subsp. vulgare TaxID=112509 RepID=UPI001D1A3CD1|nr:aspartic proteinase nepenthesin-1-like [Hordeum vulgare subsp. vulgare]
MAAPLLFLLLLLPLAPSPVSPAAVAPAPKPGKFVTKELRTTTNKSVKDYMSQRAGRPGQRKDGEQQTGSEAGDLSIFIFDLSVGTSPQTLPVIMDISTDLVWANCKSCPSCPTLSPPSMPAFHPGDSKSFAEVGCATQTCQRMSERDCTGNDVCKYTTHYMSGFLATDTFSFGNITGPGHTDVPGVVFGCSGNVTLPDLDGVSGFAGFSRGPLSLVSQLNISSFTYFLAPPDDAGAKSFVSWSWGGAADDNDDAAVVQTTTTGGSSSTPLVASKKTENPYWYYVNLTGVQVDGKLLTSIPAGTFDFPSSNGVFLSTMLPVTYLVEAAYSVLRQELVSRIQSEGAAPVNASDDEDLCFLTDDLASAKVPTLALVFDGADAAMELKVENYFLDLGDGFTCFTILPSPQGLQSSVLGSMLQAGRKMTYEIHGDGGGALTFETLEKAAGAPAPAKVPLMIVATTLLLWALLL